jgi:3,4-dihydroxy 2-butanone 4-phosphate synthase/GTP cyclohydrolase II
MSGFQPSAVIVEILNEDGTMARRPDLELFAKEHDLKIGTIADLIHYRVSNEKSVERVSECKLPTEYGDFRLVAFEDCLDNELHLALTLGDIKPDQPVLVRVHMQNTLCDIFATNHKGCSWPLRSAMQQIAEAGHGVIVVLRNHDSNREIVQRLQGLQMMCKTPPRDAPKDNQNQLRTFGIGAQILADLGVRKMRVMSAPKGLHGISGFDLEVVEYVDCK